MWFDLVFGVSMLAIGVWGHHHDAKRKNILAGKQILDSAARYLYESRLAFASVQDMGVIPTSDNEAILLIGKLKETLK